MTKIARIGIDTSKSVFQVHGVDEKERVVLRCRVGRRKFLAFMAKLEPTVIGMEACGASHYWARELTKLGHEVMLLPPQYVKAYVVRGKNDPIDAEAVCEAMSRPWARRHAVPIKSVEQSAAQMLVSLRESLIKRRTQLGNTIRGHAAEFGVVVAKGLKNIKELLRRMASDDGVPALAKDMFAVLGQQWAELGPQIVQIEKKLLTYHRTNEMARRLAEVPTIGPLGACLLVTKVVNPQIFRSGRQCAAWIGLTPKDHSTAGKQRLGVITRAGDESLRATLVCGATALIQHVMKGRTTPSPWLAELLRRKPPKLAAVALANKTARIAWKLMVSGQRYDQARAWSRPSAPTSSSLAPCSRRQGRFAPPAAVA
jgi:transposase